MDPWCLGPQTALLAARDFSNNTLILHEGAG